MSHAQVLAAERRVLLVEDDSVIRDVIMDHLESQGVAEFHAASSVAEAKDCLAVERPALIILDLMLPHQSGLEFLHERRRDPLLAPIPVLVISAAPQHLITEAKNLGADALVTKPFNLDDLAALVASFIGSSQGGQSTGG